MLKMNTLTITVVSVAAISYLTFLWLCTITMTLTVREITTSSSTFTATSISSNIVWLLQLHDTIQMKSKYTLINYNHDNIAIGNHISIYNFLWNLIFVTKFSSIYLAKGEKRFDFRLSFVNLQCAKDVTHMFDANIDVCLLYKSHEIARLVSHLITHFCKLMFTAQQENATKFGSKNDILHIFLYHWVTSYGYIMVDSCII